ncbi:MAG: peptidylprolyl isomerase [Bacteroidota bacterium]|nr:peptidylprolyl isomerase [Bacteroidota bacterium]
MINLSKEFTKMETTMMHVTKNKIVSIHYRITDPDGKIIDDNTPFDPMEYLHGHHHILAGLENALEGLAVGQEMAVILAPEDAYGAYDSEKLMEMDRSDCPVEEDQLQPGTVLESSDGMEFVVKCVNESTITLDGNHPLAGITLHCNIQIVSIRDASPEELYQKQPLSTQNKTCGPGCCC